MSVLFGSTKRDTRNRILQLLHDEGKKRPIELHQSLSANARTISRSLNDLRKEGFVKKSRNNKIPYYGLTKKGEIKFEEVRKILTRSLEFELIEKRDVFVSRFKKLVTKNGNDIFLIILSHDNKKAHRDVLEKIQPILDNVTKNGTVVWISSRKTKEVFDEFRREKQLTSVLNYYFIERNPVRISSAAVIARKNGDSILSNLYSSEGKAYYYSNKKLSADRFNFLWAFLIFSLSLGIAVPDENNIKNTISVNLNRLNLFNKIGRNLERLKDAVHSKSDKDIIDMIEKIEQSFDDEQESITEFLEGPKVEYL